MCSILPTYGIRPGLIYMPGKPYSHPILKAILSRFHTLLTPKSNPHQPMYQRRGPCWGREAHVLGAQETCLGAGRVAKHLHLGVLHGAGDGTVHEAPNPKLWYTQFAFQHGVLYNRETGRPGERTKRSSETRDLVWALEEDWRQTGPKQGWVKLLTPKRNLYLSEVPLDLKYC